jgi:alpha-tubulin suppressor-like RCC1 family protein
MRAMIALFMLAIGCADETEVVAYFFVDDELAASAAGLRVRAFDPSGSSTYDETRPEPGGSALRFPVPVLFRSEGSDALRAEATALDAAGAPLLSLGFEATYTAGERRDLALCFERACVGLGCERCVAGACVAPEIGTVPHETAHAPCVPREPEMCPGDDCSLGACAPVARVSDVSLGSTHTCAVAGDRVYCWGDNAFGKLGIDAAMSMSSTPSDVGLTGALHVAAATDHTCAVAGSSRPSVELDLYCWGRSWRGRITFQDGPDLDRASSTTFAENGASLVTDDGAGLDGRPWMLRGGDDHTCALDAGEIRCWGNNSGQQLGASSSGSEDENQAYPVEVSPPAPAASWRALDVGRRFSCAIEAPGGGLYCWGRNDGGALAMPASLFTTSEPLSMESTVRFSSLATGAAHGCAISTDGDLFCWGNDDAGQTGGVGPSLAPIGTEWGYTAVGAGDSHGCAIRDRVAYCWGSNARGQLGVEGSPDTPVPSAVSSGARFVAIAGGGAHTCAIDVDGRLYCWGANDFGQASSSPSSDVRRPTRVCFP